MSWLSRLLSGWEEGSPVPVPRGDKARIDEVSLVIDELRPAFHADGGDVHLVAVDPDGVVKVELHGACRSCPASAGTLYEALEPRLKERLGWVTRLEAV